MYLGIISYIYVHLHVLAKISFDYCMYSFIIVIYSYICKSLV